MKTVVITGITGTLGSELGRAYKKKGWRVVGVTRKDSVDPEIADIHHHSHQESVQDARHLFDHHPDLVILNSGQMEDTIGDAGMPLIDTVESMNRINYSWPCLVPLVAAEKTWDRPLEIVAIGSIADVCPSAFGPAYHSGKIGLHYYWAGVAPIVLNQSNGMIRMRLYRPGAINGPLAWLPLKRLNEWSAKIRAKRVNAAPDGAKVAQAVVRWIDRKGKWVGTYEEPLSYKSLRFLFSHFPNTFVKLQLYAWRKGSPFTQEVSNGNVDREQTMENAGAT